MVVGIQVFEKKIVYTSELCFLVAFSVSQPSPSQLTMAPLFPYTNLPKGVTNQGYYNLQGSKLELPSIPKPITRICQFIRVEGRVHNVYESQQILVQNIGGAILLIIGCKLILIYLLCRCVRSPNDELVHIKAVRDFHRTLYSKQAPFIMPPSTYSTIPTTPKNTYAPPTPSTRQSNPPSSISSSPVKPSRYVAFPELLKPR